MIRHNHITSNLNPAWDRPFCEVNKSLVDFGVVEDLTSLSSASCYEVNWIGSKQPLQPFEAGFEHRKVSLRIPSKIVAAVYDLRLAALTKRRSNILPQWKGFMATNVADGGQGAYSMLPCVATDHQEMAVADMTALRVEPAVLPAALIYQ